VKPRISFIVPVRNDAKRLEKCLHSIWRNRYALGQIQIVVVDNGSTDGSADVARQLGAQVIVIEDAPVSELRNRGARHATGDILAFVDADNEIVSGWVRAAMEILRIPGVGAVGALYRAPVDGTWVQLTYGHLRGRTQGQDDAMWLNSGNLAVQRDTFEAAGGFDMSLEACEDVDLCNRIRATGLRLVSDARLESVHHGDPKTLSDLFASELWRGRDNLRVSFRAPFTWASLPSAIVPIVDVVMVGAALLGVVTMMVAWASGVIITSAAILVIAAGSLLKVIRASAREGRAPGVGIVRTFVVACVYDLARAMALVARAPHRSARPRAAATAS
jgi:GT2 family glycosyltransferase